MRYFAQYDDAGALIAIGTGSGNGVEITPGEYAVLLSDIRQRADLVEALYAGRITLADVPAKWQADVQRQVDARREAEAAAQEEEISGGELMTMLEAIT